MKRGTPNHPKTRELAAALGVPQYAAVGILEALWHFAASYARRGDVGRHSDAALAAAIDWREKPETLVAALVETGWLDRCDCHRLRIHDWPEHADRAVAKTEDVKRRGWLECYAVGGSPADTPRNAEARPEDAPPAPSVRPTCAPHASGVYTSDARPPHACVPPLPLPLPLPTEPPSPLERSRAEGEPSLETRRRTAVRYWTRLGGRPSRQDRRALWEALAEGRPLRELLGSIAERVRGELVAAGRLAPTDPWPPEGLAPFDPPPALVSASAEDLEAGASAWERVSEALRGQLSSHAWSTWIRPCRGLWLHGRRLQVEVPGPQHLDWIGRTWSIDLQFAAAAAGLEGIDLVMPRAVEATGV